MKSETLFACLLCFTATTNLFAQGTYHRDWVAQFGTAKNDYGNSVAVCRCGMTFVSSTMGQPRVGAIQRFDACGRLLSPIRIDTDGEAMIEDLTISRQGNLLGVGYAYASVNGQPHLGMSDILLTSTYRHGCRAWTRLIGSNQPDQGWAVATDFYGNFYLCGKSRARIDNEDAHGKIIVAKYDSRGNQCWYKAVNLGTYSVPRDMAVGHDGTIWIAGYHSPKVRRGILVKLDDSGNEINRIEVNESTILNAVAIRNDGSVAFGGFSGELKGDGVVGESSPDGRSIKWMTLLQTPEHDVVNDIVVDRYGILHVAGITNGAMGTPQGGHDAILTRFDRAGKMIGEVHQFGTSSNDFVGGIAIDHCNRIVVCGSTRGTMDGNQNHGNSDAFVARFSIR